MIVATFVDPLGSLDKDPKEEQLHIIETLRCLVFHDDLVISTKHDVAPWSAHDERFDLYVIDYGGMMMGGYDDCYAALREFAKLAENYPNRLFLVWSSFSWKHLYLDALKNEIGKESQANVFLAFGDDWDEQIRAWFGLSPL